MSKNYSPRAFPLRTLTAGITLTQEEYERQFQKAFDFLQRGKKILEKNGFQVQTLRVATNSYPQFTRGLSPSDSVDFLKRLAASADEKGVFLSIGCAIIADKSDDSSLEILCSVMSETSAFSNIVISDISKGISPQSCLAAARIIKELSLRAMMTNFHFAAIAGQPAETPFFPAAFHARKQDSFGIGTEAAKLVMEATRAAGVPEIESGLTEVLEAEFRAVESAALSIEKETGWIYEGIDTSPAPMGENSIGKAVENLTGQAFGSSGTLHTCAYLTRFIQRIPVKRAGYCGLMLPVMEDSVLARRAAEGRFGLYDLLAYSAVCGTGLDVIPLSGDVEIEVLQRLLLDIAALSWKLKKPLSARLIPVPGKKAGEDVRLDSPYLVPTKIFEIP